MIEYPLVPVTEMADIFDHLRAPINLTERNKREGKYPYYGATGKVGTIDNYRQDGRYVLLGEDGAPFLDPYKPKAYIVEGRCWVNNHAHVLKGKLGICDDEYLCIALNYADYTNAVTGSTRLKLPQSLMGNLLIPKPPYQTQKIIVSIFNKQFGEFEKGKHATKIAHSETNRLGFLVLDNFLSKFKNVIKYRLGDKAFTTSGSTPSRSQKSYWTPAEIPWVKTGEIAFTPIAKVEEYISKQALKECSLRLLPVDTVLIAMYGQGKTRGQSAILKIAATTNQACFAIFPNETWHPEFLQLWLMYSYKDLRSISENRGGNQSNLNGNILNELLVPAPPLKVQIETTEKLQKALLEMEKIKHNWASIQSELRAFPLRILENAFKQNIDD